jgi:hypothetical protein
MDNYRTVDEEGSANAAVSGGLATRYAWLEHEGGTWHFLTRLFEAPTDSTRRWSTQQCAISELTKEGWVIVGTYPDNVSMPNPDCGGACGYGLMQVGHWTCEIASAAD